MYTGSSPWIWVDYILSICRLIALLMYTGSSPWIYEDCILSICRFIALLMYTGSSPWIWMDCIRSICRFIALLMKMFSIREIVGGFYHQNTSIQRMVKSRNVTLRTVLFLFVCCSIFGYASIPIIHTFSASLIYQLIISCNNFSS